VTSRIETPQSIENRTRPKQHGSRQELPCYSRGARRLRFQSPPGRKSKQMGVYRSIFQNVPTDEPRSENKCLPPENAGLPAPVMRPRNFGQKLIKIRFLDSAMAGYWPLAWLAQPGNGAAYLRNLRQSVKPESGSPMLQSAPASGRGRRG
jgi:hypothetical protein